VLESFHCGKVVGFGISTIGVDTGDDEVTLFGFEEGSAIREVDDEEAGHETEGNGDDTENDEDPSPSEEREREWRG